MTVLIATAEPRLGYYHAIQPGVDELTLCGQTPTNIFINIEWAQLSPEHRCPDCTAKETP